MPLHNTRSKQNRARKLPKYKLILDEGLSLAKSYPTLNNFHNLKHIVHDLKKPEIKDNFLYDLAARTGSILIVFNTKDFKPLIRPDKPSVISLSNNLTNKEADLKICKALRDIANSQTKGCLISISKSGIVVKVPVDERETKG